MKLLLTVLLLFPMLAFSHNFHSETVCSDEAKDACAHIGYDFEFDTTSTFEFVFHITTPGSETIEQVQVYLAQAESDLMSEPLRVEKIGPG